MRSLLSLHITFILCVYYYRNVNGGNECAEVDAVTFRSTVLETDECQRRNTDLDSFNDAVVTEAFIKGAVNMASGLIPFGSGSFISIATDTAFDITEGSWQGALNEQYDELIRCIDAKINSARSTNVEDEWTGLMSGYFAAVTKLNAGSIDGRRDVDRTFDTMSDRIITDFQRKQTSGQYLNAEALLPVAKIAIEAYLLTFTTHLGLIKEDIILGEGLMKEADYDLDLEKARNRIDTMVQWVRNAYDRIEDMYHPTVTAYNKKLELLTDPRAPAIEAREFKWSIKWENGEEEKKGSCSWDTTRDKCVDCWVKPIESEFAEYMNNIRVSYVDVVEDIFVSSYFIGKWDEPSYVASKIGWKLPCDTKTNRQGIAETISRCNEDTLCVGFNWVQQTQKGHLKHNTNNACYAPDTTYKMSDTVQFMAKTSAGVLCYYTLWEDQYPRCASGVNINCATRTQVETEKQCDGNADCIGYLWDNGRGNSCFRTADCTSHGFTTSGSYAYYAKCSKMKSIEYSNDDPLPFYHIPQEVVYHYRIHIIIGVLCAAFVCITLWLWYIAKKLRYSNKAFQPIPKMIDSDNEFD